MKIITILHKEILCTFSGSEFNESKEFIKEKLKGTWDFKAKVWKVANTPFILERLKAFGFMTQEEYSAKHKDEIKAIVSDEFVIPDYKLNPNVTPDGLRGYQKEAIQFILANKCRGIIGLSMGSGKSCISSVIMAHTNLDKPWLFVVPASLKITLAKEIRKWARMKVITVFSNFKMDEVKKNVEVIVVNYDLLDKLQNEFIGRVGGVIFDEAHYLANIDSKRTKAAMAIVAKCDKVIPMSGTLIKNKPKELWPLLYMVDPRTWRDKGHYYSRYCKPGTNFRGEVVFDGADNLEELHTKVRPYIYYKSLEEILPDLPPVQDIFYSVEITDKEYLKANREIEELIEEGKTEQAVILQKMEELSRSAFFAKRAAFYDAVDDYLEESNEKIVLVGVHKTVIADMVEKYKCEYISGSVPAQNRNAIIERFHSSDSRVLVLQLEAGSTGFSILCSRTMFFGEINYSVTTMMQMKARVRRMNTVADKCLYYFFVGEDTIDERMMQLMAKKEVISSQIITGVVSSTLKDVKYEQLISD